MTDLTQNTERAAQLWNEQADEFNQWSELDAEEKAAWVAKCAERAAFEAWFTENKFGGMKESMWAAWEARSQPAYASADGLPTLPEAVAHASKGLSAFFVKWTELAKELRGNIALYTAEQVRQAQREAVEAYARRLDPVIARLSREAESLRDEVIAADRRACKDAAMQDQEKNDATNQK